MVAPGNDSTEMDPAEDRLRDFRLDACGARRHRGEHKNSPGILPSPDLGSHIAMAKASGKVYERGSTFQPGEASLVLPVAILSDLKRRHWATDTRA